jgi:hypothetical protein
MAYLMSEIQKSKDAGDYLDAIRGNMLSGGKGPEALDIFHKKYDQQYAKLANEYEKLMNTNNSTNTMSLYSALKHNLATQSDFQKLQKQFPYALSSGHFQVPQS